MLNYKRILGLISRWMVETLLKVNSTPFEMDFVLDKAKKKLQN